MKPGRTARRKLIPVSTALLAQLLTVSSRGSGQTAPAASGPRFQGPARGVSGTPATVSPSSVPQVARGAAISTAVESSREHEIPRVKNRQTWLPLSRPRDPTRSKIHMTVTDTQTGTANTYTNPQGTAFLPIQDTNAFACP